MKAVKTVAALSTEAFEERLNDSIYELEEAGMPVLGVQTSHGLLVKLGTILFEDNLSEEQHAYRHQVKHGALASWLRLIGALILLGAAMWLLPSVLHRQELTVEAVTLLTVVAAGIVLLELLNALLGFSIRSLAWFMLGTVVCDRLISRFFFTQLPAWAALFLSAAFVSIVAIGGSPLYRKAEALLQRAAVNHRR